MEYNYAEIEKKWQKYWVEHKSGRAVTGSDKPKFYGLIEFPYPSGQGLHVGHTRPFTAMDVICRRKRMQGYNVLFPIGYDAFGLPTENYAIKNHVHPSIVTKQNIANFEKQLHMLGYSFDWDRVVDTTDPEYYKWTQWIFLRMYKKGLAYKASMPVNWCTSCKCVLANEEVVDGVCERCGSPVVRREKSQWMLAITKYADRLIDDLDDVDFIPRVKTQQRNWIGRSEGAELTFGTTLGDSLTVYTTRCDTLFGVTYMVLSPEHPILDTWKDKLTNWDAVAAYAVALVRPDREDLISGEAAPHPVLAAPGLPAPCLDALRARLAPDAELLERGLAAQAGGIDVGLARALAAVADTGSCLVEDTDENVRLATMLPDISLLLLPEGAVLPDLSAAGTVVRDALSGDAPRRLTFITGPSRTADIERVLTLGVHGPLELHILLLPPALLAEAHSYQGE